MEVPLATKVGRLCSALAERVRKDGLRPLILFFFRRAKVALKERRLGINTQGWIGAASLSSLPDCNDYEALDYESIELACSQVPFEQGPQVLLDYGSGKGRVLAVASQYPFMRILGVELSDYLCDIARQNLARLRSQRRCSSIQVLNVDAATYEVPPDVTVFFLYNPFGASVLDKVGRLIEESLLSAPRKVLVFYAHFRGKPNFFGKSEIFRFERELPLINRPGMCFSVYSA